MDRQSAHDLKQCARIHLGNNRLEQAKEVLLQAIGLEANDAEMWYLLGRIESSLERPGAAIRYYEKSIQLNSQSASACYHQALARIELQQFDKAAVNLLKCLSIDEFFPGANLALSAVYEQLGSYEKAAEYAGKVLEEDPGSIDALNRMARVKTVLGKLDEARCCYERVLEKNPKVIHAAAGLADLRMKAGDVEGAHELVAPFIRGGTTPNAIAFLFSDLCQFTGQCEEAAVIIEEILRRSTKPRVRHRRLIFALAKLYDRMKQYDRAFKAVAEANRLKRLEVHAPRLDSQADNLVRAWSGEFNARLPSARVKTDAIEPVFIVGMPRSGTSLTEQILASHPAVYGAGELGHINHAREKYFGISGPGGGYPACLQQATGSVMQQIRDDYLADWLSLPASGYRMMTDKMPENFWNLGLIRLIFPAAKIIHCTRNPLDTCISCYFADFRDGHEYTCDLSSLGAYYRQYRKVMHHWKYALEIPFYEVRYEDLVNNPEETSRMLVDYCGLEWDERCLCPHKTRRDVNTASFVQVRHRIYTTSLNRRENYAAHIGPLIEAIDGQEVFG